MIIINIGVHVCLFILSFVLYTVQVVELFCVLGRTASKPSEIISNRVCGICLGIGEGATGNVIISK